MSASLSIAAPMSGEPVKFTQPDGSVIHLRVYGDEYYAETRTVSGYTVFFDATTKAYYYAELSPNGNEFISSDSLVQTGKPPAGVPKKLTIKDQSKKKKARKNLEADEAAMERARRWKEDEGQKTARSA